MKRVKLTTDEILIILEGLYSYERSPQFRKIKLAGDKRLKSQ